MGELNFNLHSQIWILVFTFATAVAATTDYLRDKIYNWLTFPLFFLGLGLAFGFHGITGLAAALTSVGLVAIVFIPLYVLQIMGAGDVKLLMALATILTIKGVVALVSTSFMIAGVGAFVLLIYHHRVKIFFRECYKFFKSLVIPKMETVWPKLSKNIKAPFGIPIFLALFFLVTKAMGWLR